MSPLMQCRHGDVRAHLNQLDVAAVFEIKATIFGDEGNEEREGARGDGDADFFGARFFLRREDVHPNHHHRYRQDPGQY